MAAIALITLTLVTSAALSTVMASVPPGSVTGGSSNDYVAIDSTTPGGPTFNSPAYSVDINTPLFTSGDDVSVALPGGLPFAFDLPGNTTPLSAGTALYVSDNGLISFGQSSVTRTNPDFTTDAPGYALLAPYWDDLTMDGCNFDGVYDDLFGTEPNRVLVISWENVCDFDATSDGFSFEARLFENGSVVEFHYSDVSGSGDSSNGVSATVGIKGSGSESWLQYSHNTTASATPIDANFAIRFEPCTANTTVTTEAQLNQAISCYNRGLPAGDHTISIGNNILLSGPVRPIQGTNTSASLTINGNQNDLDAFFADSFVPNIVTIDGPAAVVMSDLRLSFATIGLELTSNAGTVTMRDSEISAVNFGVFAAGGRVDLERVDITMTLGSSSPQTAVSTTFGAVTIKDSTLEGISKNAVGAAVVGNEGRLSVVRSTIVNMSTAVQVSAGSAIVSNSTIGDNQVGVSTEGNDRTTIVSNSTLADNGIGIQADAASPVDLVSSIVAGGTDGCQGAPLSTNTSNFADDDACGTTLLSSGSLGPLDDNGGPTKTRSLTDGSNAIHAGTCETVVTGFNGSGMPAIGELTTDQRGAGFPRVRGSSCDAGAIEAAAGFEPPLVCEPPFVVSTESELNNAIACYNASTAELNELVMFGADITMSAAATTIDHPGDTGLLVIGNGFALRAAAGFAPGTNLLTQTAGTTTINALTVEGATRFGFEVRGGQASVVSSTFTLNGAAVVTSATGAAGVANSTLAFNTDGLLALDGTEMQVLSSTIAHNGDVALGTEAGSIIEVKGSLIAANGATCSGAGSIVNDGGNVSDTDCAAIAGTAALDGTVATSLDANGCSEPCTHTVALLAGTPAIDAAGSCDISTDQRSVDRTPGECDSGAFELGDGDVDGDGFQGTLGDGADCNDDDDSVFPGATEVADDGIDQDCDGQDLVTCNGLVVTINMQQGASGVGTSGDDVILGTVGNDTIDGLEGDDTICALGGHDTVIGGPGADTLIGDVGNDKLFGRQGHDTIDGGPGADTIHGNRGNDVLDGGDGDDRIFGYANNDTIDGGPGNDRLHGNFGDDIVNGGDGDDRIFGYGDDDRLDGDDGNDLISGNFGDDVINGGAGDDILFGADGDDIVNGGDGNDEVNGNSLNDEITGGPGNDTLDGGINVDTCSGGTGADTATRCETTTGVP